MQTTTIFTNTPYKAKAIKGAALAAEHAQEAIEDILSDSSVFIRMPKKEHIVKVRSESVYGTHKLIVTLREGVSYPEYMLSARVEALAPKLVNIFFESVGFEEDEEAFAQIQYATVNRDANPSEHATVKTPSQESLTDVSLISKTREALGVTYMELGSLIGYDPSELTKAISQGSMSRALQKALELLSENRALKKELEALRS